MGERTDGDLVKPVSTDLVPVTTAEHEIERIQAEIEATRDRIRQSIDGLQDELEDKIDWKGWIRKHPWQTVGAAFAVGFLLGSG